MRVVTFNILHCKRPAEKFASVFNLLSSLWYMVWVSPTVFLKRWGGMEVFRIVMVVIVYVNSSEHLLAHHCILVAIRDSPWLITYAQAYFVKAYSQLCDIFHIYYLSFFLISENFVLFVCFVLFCFSSTVKLILKSVIYLIFPTCSFTFFAKTSKTTLILIHGFGDESSYA